MRYCIIWIVLLLAPAWATAEEISVTITVGGVKITYEGCDGTFLEASRQSESVSITGKGMEDGFTRITREARKIARHKEETRDAFVRETYAKICAQPKIVEVKVPQPYSVKEVEVRYVNHPVTIFVPATPPPVVVEAHPVVCPYGPIPYPIPPGIVVRRWISARSFLDHHGHVWLWDPARSLWFDP